MAYITINRTKLMMVQTLKRNLQVVALNKSSENATVGVSVGYEGTQGKSDGSNFWAEPLIHSDAFTYRTYNDLKSPEYANGQLTGLNKTLNFIIEGGVPANKFVFWKRGSNRIKAVITLDTPYSSPVDTSIYVSKIEITVS